ncbi:S8 family serine peptidase [Streptomyces sp. NPDC057496]|uniref:S8 family peptidase n=1 Tax=Streptomyces sp. NPDC057496 TaxID=3346149 RepID=UPI0036B324C8
MRRFGRRLATAAAVVTALGTVVSGTTANASDPTPAPSSPASPDLSASAGDSLLKAAAGSRADLSLTLVTGDKVQIGITKDRKPVVREITPATRPGNESVLFHTVTRNDQVYVVPDDALPLLRTDVLDWELFNLAKLADWVAKGRTGQVPVIATYTGRTSARTVKPPTGTTVRTVLPGLNARSMTIKGNGQWWREVRRKNTGKSAASPASGPLAGVKKVWLNELMKLQLEQSVPQIGAPAAWERGYDGSNVKVAVLDSGIDATHPDLDGRIAEAVDFTDSPSGPVDGHGHGTHVASTIAGTGKASDGRRRGVAPGTKLHIGKVCDNEGACPGDAVLAGMEWAAESGADVVNMSLGGQATDGTDPLSTTVNRLSKTYGTLFVIAAGNNGPDKGTVGAPGAADEALTVAAVDKSDKMAPFSSRGPRVGDGAAKPDISAPGVAIVAARAKGSHMGTPDGEFYTSASGTSMATPHMTGAAAIVAQQHPDLTGKQIKALLMATSKDLGHDLFAQGAGRVDVARAVDPRITADGGLNFGRAEYPHSPVSRKITYNNWTDEPITLALSSSASSSGDKPAPEGLFALSADQVTVPAKGTADVTVTMDGRAVDSSGQYGAYTGVVTAKDGAGTLLGSSRISTFVEPIRHDLNIKVVPPTGATDVKYGNALIVPVDEDKLKLYEEPLAVPGGETTTARVFAGTVMMAMGVTWRDADGELNQAAPMLPEVKIDGATTVELDLRKVKPIRVNTPEKTETYGAVFRTHRVSADENWAITATLNAEYGPGEPHWWALPTTDEVSLGTLDFYSRHALVPPSVTMEVTGNGRPFDLDARYATPDTTITSGMQKWTEDGKPQSLLARATIPRLPVNGKKPVVYAGTGSAEELAEVDVKGALVLLKPTDICGATCGDFAELRKRVAAAAAAGAVGVLVTGETDRVALLKYESWQVYKCESGPGSCPPVKPYAALPIVTVPPAGAATLIQRIEGGAKSGVRIELGGDREVSRAYALQFHFPGEVPGNLPYQVRSRDLDRVDHRFHADRPGALPLFSWHRMTKNGPAAAVEDIMLPKPNGQRQFTTLVGPRNDNAIDRFEMSHRDWLAPSVARLTGPAETRDVVLGRKNTIDWNEGPPLPGAVPQARTKSGFTVETGLPCAGCREGDRFWPALYQTSGGGGRQTMMGMLNDTGVALYIYEMQPCEPPGCKVSLFDDAGNELEQKLNPVEFAFQLPGNVADPMSRSGR